jgi:hypothetical protein
MKKVTEQSEIKRLKKIYSTLPKNQMAVCDGLIVQAARLRVRLDQLWKDIQDHGETEMFTQSERTDPYERERPAARLFTATDKNYQSIIKQLNDLCPPDQEEDELAAFLNNG